MPQTPISSTVLVNSKTPTTVYTVPAGATAIVKSLNAASLLGANQANAIRVTTNKISNGVTYPMGNQNLPFRNATGGELATSYNLIPGPVTLSAGESITVSTSNTPFYKIPVSYNGTNQAIGNTVFANNLYVAVGQKTVSGFGLVVTSADGITWTERTFNAPEYLVDVNFGGGVWVAIGKASGQVYVSSDNAITWTTVTTNHTQPLNKIEYVNNTWIAVGNNGQFIHSTAPTTTWTVVNATAGNLANLNLTDINYVNSLYTLSTSSGSLYSSSTLNATSWTALFNIGSDSGGFYAVAWHPNSSNYIANKDNATFATTSTTKPYVSSNLANWNFTTGTTTNTTSTRFSAAYPANGSVNLISYDNGTKYMNSDSALTTFNLLDFNTSSFSSPTSCRLYAAPASQTNTRYAVVNDSSNQINFLNTNSGSTLGTATGSPVSYPSAASINWQYLNVQDVAVNLFDNRVLLMQDGSSGYPNYYLYGSIYANYNSPASPTTNLTGDYGAYGSFYYSPIIGAYNTSGWIIATSIEYAPSYGNAPKIRFISSNGTVTDLATFQSSRRFVGVATNFTGTIVFYEIYQQEFYISTNNFATYRKVKNPFGLSQGGRGCFVYQNNTWILTDTSNGRIVYSTDLDNWFSAPRNVFNQATVNSLNVYLSAQDGVLSTTNPTTSWTFYTSTNLTNSSQLSLRNIAYVNNSYYVASGTIYTGSSLSSLSTYGLDTNQVNDTVYVAGATNSSGLAVFTNGTNRIGFSSAEPNNANTRALIGTTTNLNATLQVGTVTAGIVEIT